MPVTMRVRRSRRAGYTEGRSGPRRRIDRQSRWAALEARYPDSVYDIIVERVLAALAPAAPRSPSRALGHARTIARNN